LYIINAVSLIFNIYRIGPKKRVSGKSDKAETTIFWPHYSGKCRTVSTYSPRRNHGRVTASRPTEKVWYGIVEFNVPLDTL